MIALTRAVSPVIERCQLSHLERRPIDPERAVAQHAAYEAALRALGCQVVRVPASPDLPDSVFVEDTAVVTDEVAVIARPGAPSRRGEVDAVAAVLDAYRPVRYIEPPGTLDGGDVLVVGEVVFVGDSARTDSGGAAQLRTILEPCGYDVHRVPVHGCLHLKTAVTALPDGSLVLNPDWVDPARFEGFGLVEVHPEEPFAANVLRVGDALLDAAAHVRTRRRLEARGWHVHSVDVSELAKAEAGVTCSTLLVHEGLAPDGGPAPGTRQRRVGPNREVP